MFAPEQLSCPEIGGLAPLMVPGAVVVLGEIHGTVESPRFAADAVCSALEAGLAVTVALEIEREEARRVEVFLRQGSPQARADLLAGAFWQSEYQDGRRSEARVALLDRLGQMRRAGHNVKVVLLDSVVFVGDPHRDAEMAATLVDAAKVDPRGWIVGLVGNLHARVTLGSPWDPNFEPMAYLAKRSLQGRFLVGLDVASPGGSAWSCPSADPATCGVRAVPARSHEPGASALRLDGEKGSPYDGHYEAGPLTASPPAIGTSR